MLMSFSSKRHSQTVIAASSSHVQALYALPVLIQTTNIRTEDRDWDRTGHISAGPDQDWQSGSSPVTSPSSVLGPDHTTLLILRLPKRKRGNQLCTDGNYRDMTRRFVADIASAGPDL